MKTKKIKALTKLVKASRAAHQHLPQRIPALLPLLDEIAKPTKGVDLFEVLAKLKVVLNGDFKNQWADEMVAKGFPPLTQE